MNIKKPIAFFAIAMAVAFVASVGMASAALPVKKTLYADQVIDVGTVTVDSDANGFITITYAITAVDWELTAYHVYVDTVKPTKSAPGKFQYKRDVAPTTSIDVLTTVPATQTLYIAAQAELQRDTGEVDADGNTIYQYESGWASGGESGDVAIPPGKNWATYFVVNPVRKYASKENVKPGEEVLYTIKVINPSDSVLGMMEVKEMMPNEMIYVDGSCSLLKSNTKVVETKETVMKSGRSETIMTWKVDDNSRILEIAPGASTEFTLTAKIDENAAIGQILRNVIVVIVQRAGGVGFTTHTAETFVKVIA